MNEIENQVERMLLKDMRQVLMRQGRYTGRFGRRVRESSLGSLVVSRTVTRPVYHDPKLRLLGILTGLEQGRGSNKV